MYDGFNILIVDDEPNIRSGLAKGLMKEADVIETARDVHDVLEKFDEGDFRLVIADVRLPGDRDGLESSNHACATSSVGLDVEDLTLCFEKSRATRSRTKPAPAQ